MDWGLDRVLALACLKLSVCCININALAGILLIIPCTTEDYLVQAVNN